MIERFMSILRRETSTRSAALLRIGLVVIIWAKHGDNFLLFRNMHPEGFPLALLFYGSTALMFLGLFSQPAAFVAGSVQLYGFYVIGGGNWVHHNTYLLAVATLLMALIPCGRSYSLSRWRGLRRGKVLPERGATWALSLITLQVSIAYFWGAVDKCEAQYLSGDRLEQISLYLYFGSDYPSLPGFHHLMVAGAWGSVILEYWLAAALWLPKQRRYAIVAGILFHAMIYVVLPVSTFSVMMWMLYLAACDPDEVHRVLDWMQEAHNGDDELKSPRRRAG
jgi:hypothetical protein